MIDYYDRDGQPITRDEWVALFAQSNMDYRQIARSVVDGVMVSTVWLGLDHQYGDGPPLIFETLIMEGPPDGEMWRYSTEAEAVAGHARAVEMVRA